MLQIRATFFYCKLGQTLLQVGAALLLQIGQELLLTGAALTT